MAVFSSCVLNCVCSFSKYKMIQRSFARLGAQFLQAAKTRFLLGAPPNTKEAAPISNRGSLFSAVYRRMTNMCGIFSRGDFIAVKMQIVAAMQDARLAPPLEPHAARQQDIARTFIPFKMAAVNFTEATI